jgi:hypothetical protein
LKVLRGSSKPLASQSASHKEVLEIEANISNSLEIGKKLIKQPETGFVRIGAS